MSTEATITNDGATNENNINVVETSNSRGEWTIERVMRTIKSRKTTPITRQQAEDAVQVETSVVSEPTEMIVKNSAGEVIYDDNNKPLRKRIINVALNSAVALSSQYVKDFLIAAREAEELGDTETASKNYAEYVNKVGISFSMLSNHSLYDEIGKNSKIKVDLELIVNEDNGRELISCNPKKLSMVKAFVAKDSKKELDLEALLAM